MWTGLTRRSWPEEIFCKSHVAKESLLDWEYSHLEQHAERRTKSLQEGSHYRIVDPSPYGDILAWAGSRSIIRQSTEHRGRTDEWCRRCNKRVWVDKKSLKEADRLALVLCDSCYFELDEAKRRSKR